MAVAAERLSQQTRREILGPERIYGLGLDLEVPTFFYLRGRTIFSIYLSAAEIAEGKNLILAERRSKRHQPRQFFVGVYQGESPIGEESDGDEVELNGYLKTLLTTGRPIPAEELDLEVAEIVFKEIEGQHL